MNTMSKNIVVLLIVLVGMFFSCKNDDTVINEESTLLDLSKLEQDDQYLEYVAQIYTVGQQVQNPNVMSTIIESGEEITDKQKEELALAMGFDTVLDLEEFYTSQEKLMSEITERYDLENKNDINVAEIFKRIMLNNRNKKLQNNNGQRDIKNDKFPNNCPDEQQVCDDSLFLNSPGLNNPEFIEEYFCSNFSKDSPRWNNCTRMAMNKLALEWELTKLEWCLCMIQVDCNWPQEIYDECGIW